MKKLLILLGLALLMLPFFGCPKKPAQAPTPTQSPTMSKDYQEWRAKVDMETERTIMALGSGNPLARKQMTDKLGKEKIDKAVTTLNTLLQDKNLQIRRRAAFLLGRIGDSKAVPALSKGLKDQDPIMRRLSAMALGRIGDKKSLPALKGLLKDSNPMVRRAAQTSISRIEHGGRPMPNKMGRLQMPLKTKPTTPKSK